MGIKHWCGADMNVGLQLRFIHSPLLCSRLFFFPFTFFLLPCHSAPLPLCYFLPLLLFPFATLRLCASVPLCLCGFLRLPFAVSRLTSLCLCYFVPLLLPLYIPSNTNFPPTFSYRKSSVKQIASRISSIGFFSKDPEIDSICKFGLRNSIFKS